MNPCSSFYPDGASHSQELVSRGSGMNIPHTVLIVTTVIAYRISISSGEKWRLGGGPTLLGQMHHVTSRRHRRMACHIEWELYQCTTKIKSDSEAYLHSKSVRFSPQKMFTFKRYSVKPITLCKWPLLTQSKYLRYAFSRLNPEPTSLKNFRAKPNVYENRLRIECHNRFRSSVILSRAGQA